VVADIRGPPGLAPRNPDRKRAAGAPPRVT